MKNKKIVAIIQARMSSTRLPCKVLMDISGKPMLWYMVERIKKSRLIENVVIATTTNERDKEIVDFCKDNGILYFRGSEEDVLDRYYQTARRFRIDPIVRMSSDCPLIDYKVIDWVIDNFKNSELDYLGSGKTFPEGYDIEIFTFRALESAWHEARLMSEREHVATYIWKNIDKFKVERLQMEKDYSYIRITVDEEKDFIVVKAIFENFYPKKGNDFYLEDIVKFLETNREIYNINKDIPRNLGYLKSLKEDRIVK